MCFLPFTRRLVHIPPVKEVLLSLGFTDEKTGLERLGNTVEDTQQVNRRTRGEIQSSCLPLIPPFSPRICKKYAKLLA